MAQTAVTFKSVDYNYNQGTKIAHHGISGVQLRIVSGSFTGIIGKTGSGKSTLVKLIDGLLLPTSGEVIVNGHHLNATTRHHELALLRSQVGFVFQFPEQQLFADTVAHDIAFGPTNLGWGTNQVEQAVQAAMHSVGLPEQIAPRSPLTLSGGQQKLVAIAGVLAMHPQILILDEPTAGLDSHSTRIILNLLDRLHAEGITIIMISHQLELLATRADQIILMNNGQLAFQGAPSDLLTDPKCLKENQLQAPVAVQIASQLGLSRLPLSINELAAEVASHLKDGGKNE